MKNKTLKYLLLSALIALSLSFTACSKEPEPVNQSAETIAEESTEETAEESTEEIAGESAEDIAAEEPAATTETSDDASDNYYVEYGKNDASLEGYEVTITEVLDTQMYVVKEYDFRKLDNEKAGKISPAEIGSYLTVTGKTSNGWYEIQCGLVKGYLPPEILSTENPLPPVDMNEVNPNTGETTQEMIDWINEVMEDPALDDIIGPAHDGEWIYGGDAKEGFEAAKNSW